MSGDLRGGLILHEDGGGGKAGAWSVRGGRAMVERKQERMLREKGIEAGSFGGWRVETVVGGAFNPTTQKRVLLTVMW
jgi:hypothetical protein